MSAQRIVIAGGSGFLGQALARHFLDGGSEVDVLTRTPGASLPGHPVAWDGATIGDWAQRIDGADAVINLTGKSVNCRYTPTNRREIVESRVDSVRAIEGAITRAESPPKVWVQSGSLAIYGNPGAAVCDENAPHGSGFSSWVCEEWEGAFNGAVTPSTRKVLLRIGFVLGRSGGALETLVPLARWGLGGTAGNGRQYISWIDVDDFNRMVEWSIAHDQASGVYNATGPEAVTNAVFVRALRKAVHRPWSPPAPAWAVRLGSIVMRTEPELALGGRRCVPRRMLEEGFAFHHTDLEAALRSAVQRGVVEH